MKKKVITGVVIVAIATIIIIPKLDLFGDKPDVQNTGRSQGESLPVEVTVIKTGELSNRVIVTGSVFANESLEVKGEISGKITNISFQEGKRVSKGDLLVQINDDEIEAQLEKQRHNQELYKSIEVRQVKLKERDAISQEEYDNAYNRLKTTEADIKLLEAQLAKTRIRAPFSGIIGLRYVSEGAYISPNSVIATLYSINPAKVEFSVAGRYSTQVKVGQKIKFQIENNEEELEGTVYAIEPQIDPNTRTLKVRALAENSRGLLLPGQFVRVELILETIGNAILIPTESVIPVMNGHKVFLKEGNKAKEVTVQTGIRTNLELEILSGLKTGDTLITTGLLQLRPGMSVDVVKVID
jgi:membrane fusion protein (multidrug efflux system)